jgi:uncharacterized protein DUF4399
MKNYVSDITLKPILILIATALLFITSTNVLSYGNKPAKPKQSVYFIEPADGATVSQEFKVVMGLKGMTIKPAGEMIDNTGHHHLLIDEEPIAKGEVVPAGSPTHLHFGKGQTETTLTLEPGQHTLMLQFADGAHQSYGEKLRASITVNVE